MKLVKSKKIIIILVTVILLISVSFTVKPKEDPNIFEKGLEFIFVPIQNFVNWPIIKVRNAVDFFAEMKGYKIENERLSKENLELKEKVRRLQTDGKENEKLRQLLSLSEKYSEKETVVAEVISKGTGSWFDVFTINKGKNDGIKVNAVVLTHEGLVGKVTQVYDNSAKVTSILDASNYVGAVITKTGESVTACGDVNLKTKGLLKINYITSEVPLIKGDVIETSGIGGQESIYPAGIFIGKVNEVQGESSSLVTRYAVVEPGVDFKALREVLVLKERN